MSSSGYEQPVRLLFHPALSDISVEGILYALSDPVRAKIYAELATSECALTCSDVRKLVNSTLPKATLSQHFKILREAGLVHSERKGVEMHNTTRRAELEERFGDMLSAILNTLHRSEFATASIRACASADGSLEPSVSSREGKKRAGSQSRQCKRSGTR
jgi:DNA-binding transcriptional ArsR family regulator